jgi:hypothetical protein
VRVAWDAVYAGDEELQSDGRRTNGFVCVCVCVCVFLTITVDTLLVYVTVFTCVTHQ